MSSSSGSSIRASSPKSPDAEGHRVAISAEASGVVGPTDRLPNRTRTANWPVFTPLRTTQQDAKLINIEAERQQGNYKLRAKDYQVSHA